MTDLGRQTSQALERVAVVERLLVASDFDGVLAPIVEDPGAAQAMPEALGALRDLAARSNTMVAVVSGRHHRLLQELVGETEPFVLVGSHGAELGEVELTAEEQVTFDRLVSALHALAERYPGLHIEAKTVSAAAHFRRMDHGKTEAMAAIDELAAAWPAKIVAGKQVVEFTLRHATKGDAIRALADRHEADAVVYFGDDVTDEDVFAVLGDGDVGVKVGEGATMATHRVAAPAEVTAALIDLARARPA